MFCSFLFHFQLKFIYVSGDTYDQILCLAASDLGLHLFSYFSFITPGREELKAFFLINTTKNEIAHKN